VVVSRTTDTLNTAFGDLDLFVIECIIAVGLLQQFVHICAKLCI